MSLLNQLEKLAARHKELSALLSREDATSNMERFTALNKEYAELSPVVEAYTAYAAMQREMDDLEQLLAESSTDADMRAMAQEEYYALKEKIPQAEHDLQLRLLPKDKNDDKNVILEVRAGTGGDEAALFAGDIFNMYTRYADVKGWKTELLEESHSEVGGYKEVILQISGAGVYARLKFESGVHRVQRVPATESQGRIHTSAITVAVLPEAEDIEININPADLRIDTYRSSGAGGQHVNTTDSAVRITHLPTGVVAQCQDEKSQHKNRDKAMKMLKARILDQQEQEAAKNRADARKSQVGSGDRSERIRTYNFPQSRVTDHRINLTSHNLSGILSGEGLDEMIEALITEDQARKLAEIGEKSTNKAENAA